MIRSRPLLFRLASFGKPPSSYLRTRIFHFVLLGKDLTRTGGSTLSLLRRYNGT